MQIPYESISDRIVAGGGAGMMEALACHPLGRSHLAMMYECVLIDVDTIKVRMQLSRRARTPGVRIILNDERLN